MSNDEQLNSLKAGFVKFLFEIPLGVSNRHIILNKYNEAVDTAAACGYERAVKSALAVVAMRARRSGQTEVPISGKVS